MYARRVHLYDATGMDIYWDRWERVIPEERPREYVVREEYMSKYQEALQELDRWRREELGNEMEEYTHSDEVHY